MLITSGNLSKLISENFDRALEEPVNTLVQWRPFYHNRHNIKDRNNFVKYQEYHKKDINILQLSVNLINHTGLE